MRIRGLSGFSCLFPLKLIKNANQDYKNLEDEQD